MSPPWQEPKGVLWNIFSSSRMQRPHVGSKIWLIYGDISLNRETQTRATLEKKKRVAKNNFYSEKKSKFIWRKDLGTDILLAATARFIVSPFENSTTNRIQWSNNSKVISTEKKRQTILLVVQTTAGTTSRRFSPCLITRKGAWNANTKQTQKMYNFQTMTSENDARNLVALTDSFEHSQQV